jgi:hypothetical protein
VIGDDPGIDDLTSMMIAYPAGTSDIGSMLQEMP